MITTPKQKRTATEAGDPDDTEQKPNPGDPGFEQPEEGKKREPPQAPPSPH